jgi:hypothetical protein
MDPLLPSPSNTALSVSLGNTVEATPSAVSGIGSQEVYAEVSGLTTTGLNYFRVRAENSGGRDNRTGQALLYRPARDPKLEF